MIELKKTGLALDGKGGDEGSGGNSAVKVYD